jgi:hypothetical protein
VLYLVHISHDFRSQTFVKDYETGTEAWANHLIGSIKSSLMVLLVSTSFYLLPQFYGYVTINGFML